MSFLSDKYKFECTPMKFDVEQPIILNRNIYRSEYFEFEQGSKSVSCKFTIVKYQNKYSAFVHSIDDYKKKNVKIEFKGNFLWGFGKPLKLEALIERIKSYTNLEQVKNDFDL